MCTLPYIRRATYSPIQVNVLMKTMHAQITRVNSTMVYLAWAAAGMNCRLSISFRPAHCLLWTPTLGEDSSHVIQSSLYFLCVLPNYHKIVKKSPLFSTSLYFQDGTKVYGRCGGFCGKCIPHMATGLPIQVLWTFRIWTFDKNGGGGCSVKTQVSGAPFSLLASWDVHSKPFWSGCSSGFQST